jgi:hypothetical protein
LAPRCHSRILSIRSAYSASCSPPCAFISATVSDRGQRTLFGCSTEPESNHRRRHAVQPYCDDHQGIEKSNVIMVEGPLYPDIIHKAILGRLEKTRII